MARTRNKISKIANDITITVDFIYQFIYNYFVRYKVQVERLHNRCAFVSDKVRKQQLTGIAFISNVN